MLEFAYALDAGNASEIKDFPLDSWATTAVGYNQGITGVSAAPKKGDLVYLNAGKLRRAYDAASLKGIGIVEGFEYVGIGGPATGANPVDSSVANASFIASVTDATRYPNGIAKVRVANQAVYRIPASGALSNANVGVAYGLTVSAAGDQTLDLTETTNTYFKVVDFKGTTAYVTLLSNPTL